MGDRDDITQLLLLARAGDEIAEAKLFQILYSDLRRVAAGCLRRERPDHTLQPTELVNEAYLRLASQLDKDWQNRAHFLAVAAQVMRRVLVDWARARGTAKRGGGLRKVELNESSSQVQSWSERILDLEQALQELAVQDPRAARVVELRFFGRLNDQEIAKIVNITKRTVSRDWTFARAWLQGMLTRDGSETASWFRAVIGN